MARIRSIHPGLSTDEAFMSMTAYAKAAWPILWTECDDQGVFEWKPVVLKARILPADNVDFADLMEEWAGLGCVMRFEAGGKSYGAIRNFRRYQRPKKPNAVHPCPPDVGTYTGLRAASSPPVPNRHGSEGGNPAPMEDEGGKREEEEQSAQPEQGAARQMPSGAVAALRWTKDEFDRVEAECRKAAEIGGLSPCWPECSAIIGLMEAGYDLERDILPQIRSQTQRLGKPAGSPNYYVKGIREAADRRREIAAVPKPSGGASDDEWRKRMERWRDSGKWSEARSWGAPPGQAGCVVPDRILREFPAPLPRAVG